MILCMNKKYDKTKEYYNAACNRYALRNDVAMHDNINLFLKHVNKNNLILDIGCGPGHDVQYMIEQGYYAIGVDFSERMIEYAKKNHLGTFYCMNACSDNLFKNIDDVNSVWISAMLMHLSYDDQKSLLKKIHTNIHNGIVGMIVPLELDESRKKNDVLFYIYTKKELHKLLNDTNFKPLQFSTFKFNNMQWGIIIARPKK